MDLTARMCGLQPIDLPPWAIRTTNRAEGWTNVTVHIRRRSNVGWMGDSLHLSVQAHLLGALHHSITGCRVERINIHTKET